MKIRLLLFVTLLFSVVSWGQVTIVSDGLNNATTLFTLTSGAYSTGNSAAGDRPATSALASEGTHSYGISSGTATLLSNADINTSGYTSVFMTIRLASFSITSTGNGADAGDNVTVEVSPDGGTTWYSTVRVLGNANAYWAYSATGNASTAYDGNATPVDFQPAGGASRTTDGYSTITVTGLPSISNLRFRIKLLNDSANERWLVDDFKVQGTVATNTITTNTSLTGSPYCVSASVGAAVSVPFTSTGTFTGANVYTAQLSSAAGSFAAPVSIGTLSSTANSGTITATIPAGTAAGAGYRIRVVSDTPATTGTDNTVNLTVSTIVSITTQPSVSTQNICQGSSATALSVTAAGTGMTYQWYSNTAASNSGGTLIGAATANTYTPLTSTAGTLYYYCIITGSCGALTTNVSGDINVTALPATPSAPTAAANPSCGSTTLNAMTAPGGETYYWQGTTSNGTSTASNANVTYTVPSTGTYYVRSRNNTTLCWSAQSSIAMTINTVPTTPTTAATASACEGSAATITGTGGGATLYTFWDAASGGTKYLTGVNGYTITATVLTTPTALTAGTYTYYVQGETATCVSAARKLVTLTITAIPADPAGTITASANPSCGAATLTYSAPSATLYWQTTAGGTSTANPTTSTYNAASTGTYYVRSNSGSCWSTGTASLAVTINAAVNITAQPTNQTVVVGSTAAFSVTATGAASYQWQESTDGGSTWSNVGTNSNSYTTAATTLGMNTYQYQVLVSGTAPCATATSTAAILTVTTAPCLSENFAVNALPSGWAQNTITFTTNYAEFGGNNGDLATIAVSNPTSLTFTLARTSNGTAKDMIVEVSTTSQAAGFTTVTTYDHSNTISNSTTNCTVDLSAYTSNSTVYIRFRKASATTSPWRLDDINVYCGAPSSPTITVSPTSLSGMTYVFGAGPSGFTTFNASGVNLTNNIVLTAPTDYEIATTSGGVYGGSITLTQVSGTVASTPIYVRLKAGLSVNTYNSENIAATSTGATTRNVACSGNVTAAPAANNLCGNATVLTVNAAATAGNMTGSTVTAPFAEKDVWYTFTPSCTGTHVVTVSGFTGDIDIELFSGSCPATTTTIAGSAGATSTETFTTSLTSGTVYYLRVLAYNATAETSAFTAQVVSSSVLTLTNGGSPAAGNIPAGVTNAVIMGFTATPSCATSYSITSVVLTKASGTATTSDISNFRVFYDANANGIVDGAEASVSGAGVALAGSWTFTLSLQTGITTARSYLLVADIAAGAVNGRTIKVNVSSNSDLTAVLTPAGTGTGTATGNTQTITYAACATPAAQPTVLSFSGVISHGFNGSFTAASPAASGYLVVYSTNATLSAGDLPINGIVYTGGSTIGDGTVAQAAAGTSFTLTGLSAATTYYVFVFAYTTGGACSISYQTTAPLTGSQLTDIGYCTSNGNMSYNTSVTNVALNTINNASLTKTASYMDYTSISTTLQRNESYPLSVKLNTAGNYLVLAFAWIDFNHDGDFDDAGEAFGLGSATNVTNGLTNLSPLTITIPATATLGTTTMRVIATYDGDSSPCLTGFDGEVEDYSINITAACVPTHSITSYAPASGPTGTEVTVTGAGFTTGTTVTFNGITATVVFVNSTTLTVTVPSGITTGNMVVTEAGCKLTAGSFTQIKQTGSCASTNNLTDLIISEVYDSVGGNSWYMELYNPTSSAIDLDAAGANYKLVRYGDIGTTIGIRTVDISGVIAPGGIYLADLGSDSFCGALAFNFVAKANGINENDEIRLTKNDVTVDIVNCPNEKGYSIFRKVTAVGPSAIYNAADWTLNLVENCGNLGTVPFTFSNTTPLVNTNPADVNVCGSTASFAITATASSGALTYQWFYNNGVTAGWTSLTTLAGLTVTGATTNSITLTGTVASYNGYQFYCQVTESGTCSIASDAAQLRVYSTTWNGSAWSNGTPTLGMLTTINGNYNTTTNGDIDACSLIVKTGFTATVTANHYINIQNDLTVEAGGTLDVLNNGSLVQVSDTGVDTGTILMKRTANIRLYDYVYWSSPVVNFPVASVSPSSPTGVIFKWNPTVANTNGGFGNWENTTENMVTAKGYIVRGPTGFNNTAPQAMTANFSGVPHNGIYTPSIIRGSNTAADYPGTNGITITNKEDNWNLIGNPYPSAIKSLDFLAANTNIEGAVRLWTHGTLPNAATPNPFYGSFAYNYTATDYIVHNGTATTSGPAGFNGLIAAGQSFLVLMNDGVAATQTVTFNNALRSKTYDNSQFYKNANSQKAVGGAVQHRIWLDLISSTNVINRTVVGYVEGATDQKDRMYDAYTDYKNAQNFYSLINDEVMIIQGKSLPFKVADRVPMGIKIPSNGTYQIAIAAADGVFTSGGQTVYLEDLLLNVIHNLSAAPYQFTTVPGIINNRFVLRYTDAALGNDSFEIVENGVAVATQNHEIHIKSQLEPMKNITVYDVLGRLVFEKNNVNNTVFAIQNMVVSQQALIVKIILENGQAVSKKIVF